MRKLFTEEVLELTSEITKIYLQYKKEYQLNGNTSCQFMARSCCIIIERMTDEQSTKLKKHIERCLVAISSKTNFNSLHGKCVSKLKLYDGEIPHIFTELEQAYVRIPSETKELDLQYNNRQALNGFLDDIYRTLKGCNHQESFDKPDFMNIN
ncbi:hypothetical protein QWY97_04140 [Vibrio cortegadensis]|uniref:hypothetical protein n=1 Tax=Vibrio cortegadensis TaxID=1328770 RepID=UPI0021C3F168|nr:hypothetical protein [Vibrio cortegadensis]MDN3696540.1 hypothetical protein [Vibrio cortegadensis]